jgi:hypothetical protein
MDANSFLKRITLIALVSALPTFVSLARRAAAVIPLAKQWWRLWTR